MTSELTWASLVMSAADWETNGEQVNTITNTSPILQSKFVLK